VQRPAAEPLHHEDAQPFVLDEVVDRDDVGVAERRQQPRLVDEAAAHDDVVGQVRRQHLHGHPPAQLAMLGGEHHAGRAPAQLLTELIGRQGRGELVLEGHQAAKHKLRARRQV